MLQIRPPLASLDANISLKKESEISHPRHLALSAHHAHVLRSITSRAEGLCYSVLFDDPLEAIAGLGKFPTLGQVAGWEPADSEFGPWCSNVGDGQLQTYANFGTGLGLQEFKGYKPLHVTEGGVALDALTLARWCDRKVGIDIQGLITKCGQLNEVETEALVDLLSSTSTCPEDSSHNYEALGDFLVSARNGALNKAITKTRFRNLMRVVIAKWARGGESAASANLAADLLYGGEFDYWDPRAFEEIAAEGCGQDEKRSIAVNAGRMVFQNVRGDDFAGAVRRNLAPWAASVTSPFKEFTLPVGVSNAEIDHFLKSVNPCSNLKWAIEQLGHHATKAVPALTTIATGGAVAATVVVAAGLILDAFYRGKSGTLSGQKRETSAPFFAHSATPLRPSDLYPVAMAMSDQTYDLQSHVQVVRVDPFFFYARNSVSKLKDDSPAMRQMTNALLPPILQNITSNDKSVILLPATITDESAYHIQAAMPEFYFRIVNRSHSHPELWATRRGFEVTAARAAAAMRNHPNVVMIGANVRQTAKIPGVVANYGPVLSGRDEARHRLKGTRQQKAFFDSVTINESFGKKPMQFRGCVGMAFYSTQDMTKQDYLSAAISSNITKHFVAVNIPIVMMDERVTEWDDEVLNCRYIRRGGVLSMAPLNMPVAGYDNSFEATMSWAKPIPPFPGYDVTISVLSMVGSSYLLEIEIGAGRQEASDTIWRMPDAGHYVLSDVTMVNHEVGTQFMGSAKDNTFYMVPADRFDQVVKFVTQLNGAKNMVEATAGRILGLEAEIKIGGQVLSRAWRQTNGQFLSTVVHAMTCAGVSKGDSLEMLHHLRKHFEIEELSFFERVLRGWRKLAGVDVDWRAPLRKHGRGVSDYYAVKHWTMRQPAGLLHDKPGLPFIEGDFLEESEDEGYGTGAYTSSDDISVIASSPSDSGSDSVSRTSVGTIASEQLPIESEGDDGLVVHSALEEVSASSDGDFGFAPDSATRQLLIDEDEVLRLRTSSNFEPLGELDFSDDGSRSNRAFALAAASHPDLVGLLEAGGEFPCPDKGAVTVLAYAFRRAFTSTLSYAGLTPGVPEDMSGAREELQKLVQDFYFDVGDKMQMAVPCLLLDGIAGSAKSSVTRLFMDNLRVSSAVVVPTRRLAKEWRAHKLGTVVTKHKLMCSTLRGRNLLVIDEVYAFTRAELNACLRKAAFTGTKVILLGDRRQQYEDGAEITSTDIASLGVPIMRMCVSNTMPVDSVKIAVWAAGTDGMRDLFQTRSNVTHSICMKQKDQAADRQLVLDAVPRPDVLVFKDRSGPELQYETATDAEMGFAVGHESDWLSTSRVQGVRTKHALMLTSRFTKSMRWFDEQPGLFYVATSRHSRSMMCMVDQFDLSLLVGLRFENQDIVRGRLAAKQYRERVDAPFCVVEASITKCNSVLERMLQRGACVQSQRFASLGHIREDWRPWSKFSSVTSGFASDVFRATTQSLAGSSVPYIYTEAAKLPVYQDAKGLRSVRRPELREPEQLQTDFPGLDRLAVLQNSKDELLDQKNVIERTARPRTLDESEARITATAERMYTSLRRVMFSDEWKTAPLSSRPAADEWACTRTTDFAVKYDSSDPYGCTAFSVRSQGFLKTQTKVKLKRSFALEENYGQTVLASPPDMNAMFGPWSKMMLRNIKLLCRDGLILDSGYSDKEVARIFRSNGALKRFQIENFQADVKRQDSSHTPVTLRIFKMLMIDMGVPAELAELYEQHSKQYAYHSLHKGLYKGVAKYNLGSGDPFTLIRNIIQVLTVMYERYGDQLLDASMIIKGDDLLADKVFQLLPTTVLELRQVDLTIDVNKPPYHAGRFFLPDDVVPDPVRMVSKILVKKTNDMDRANQLSESFYDRYVHLTDYSYHEVLLRSRACYSDFEVDFCDAAVEMYHALQDRNMFFNLLCGDASLTKERLVVLDSETDCARFAVSKFIDDPAFLQQIVDEDARTIEIILSSRNIPVHRVQGRPNDFLKRGVWLSSDHAWAVIGLTEFEDFDDIE